AAVRIRTRGRHAGGSVHGALRGPAAARGPRDVAGQRARHRGASTPVHEAWLSMSQRERLTFDDREQFLSYAARTMRGLVVDRVRARLTQKRGGGLDITSLDDHADDELAQPEPLEDIGDALDELARLEPELASVVELQFYCGFTLADVARMKGVSERTVQRQWEKARLLLFRAMKPD